MRASTARCGALWNILIAASCWSTTAGAQVIPSILGTFAGTTAEVRTCSNPADNGTFTDALTLVFKSQDANGNFTGTDVDPDGDPATLTGTVLAAGAIANGSFLSSDSSGSFGGLLSGNTLSLSYSGSDADCTFVGGGTLTRDGQVVVPADEPGTQTTGPQRVSNFARGFTSIVGTHTSTALSGRRTGASPINNGFLLQGGPAGMSAGEGARLPFGVWGSYSRGRSENTFTSTEYKSDHDVFLGGLDFLPSDSLVMGVTVGYVNSDATTHFNGGKQKLDAFTIGPYFGALVNDWLSVDFAAAWSLTQFDQYRIDPGTGANVTSDPDGNQVLISGNVNVNRALGNWLLSGRLGALWASDTVQAFVESNGTAVSRNESKLGQLRVGAEVAYAAGRFEPYAGGTYEYDYSRSGLVLAPGLPQPSDDDSGLVLNFGVRYYGAQSFSGSLEYNKVLGRSDFSMDSLMLMLRGDF
jgi:hypothetical protein